MNVATLVSGITRQARKKALLAANFLKIAVLFVKRPRALAKQIANRETPFAIGPKLFAATGIGIFILVSQLNPVSSAKVGWIDATNNLSGEDKLAFLAAFHLSVVDFARYDEVEVIWHGVSPLSKSIALQAGSESIDDVAIFLSGIDRQLARRFSKEAKVAELEGRILESWKQLIWPLVLFIGAAVYHKVVQPKGVTLGTSMNLASYYSGYYFLVFSLFILMRYPFDHPIGSEAKVILWFELALGAYMIVLFCAFMNQVHRSGTGRVIAAFLAAGVSAVVTLLLLGLLVTWIVDIQFVNDLLHRFAEAS